MSPSTPIFFWSPIGHTKQNKTDKELKSTEDSSFMDPTREEVEIPMPLNSAYPRTHHLHYSNMFNQYHYHDYHRHHNHDHHHHHQGQVRYRECLKNHAASKGGNIRDGCGEFMPSKEEEEEDEENSMEALICAVCNCHRNFHRKEVEVETEEGSNGKKLIELGHHYNSHKKMNMLSPTGRMIPYNMGSLLVYSDQSDGQDELGGAGTGAASPGVAYMGFPLPHPPPSSTSTCKKRFRTKFTAEQKEKMVSFAEKIGWTIKNQEETEIQSFCNEIGVKRKVLKVWMHNNKNSPNKNTSLATTTDDHGC